MRHLFILSFLISFQLNAQMDTTSYSAGLVIAKNLKSQGIESLDMASFNQAMADVFNGDNLKISLDEANNIFKAFMQKSMSEIGLKNKKYGLDFLAKNGKRAEVTTTESGLQYEVITQGPEGARPSLFDKVNVHYHGTLIDGTVFDSSVDRNEPISFPLNGVIKGWQEGVQLMTVGTTYRFYIPYDLAYGERGAGELIKPYSALIFDVTLLAIE